MQRNTKPGRKGPQQQGTGPKGPSKGRASGKPAGAQRGSSFDRRPGRPDARESGREQGRGFQGQRGGQKPQYNQPADRGYEESSRNNRQYERYGRPDSQRQDSSSRQGAGNRYGRPASPQAESQRRGTPASLRFGPGSKQVLKPAPRPFRQPQQALVPAAPQNLPAADYLQEGEDSLQHVNLLTGRNPIREAIKTGRDLEKLMIAKGELSGSAREIVSLAKKAGIMIQSVERSRLDQLVKNHQGMVAFASAYKYATVEDILETARSRGEDPFIIMLDQVTDPHNLGAVIRTAACAGAHGVVVPLHRSVGLTPAAVKASAGAVEHIQVARVTNLNQTIKSLQKQGVWFYAAQTEGEDYRSVAFQGPCALVIGSEGEGVSQLTAATCDKQVRIPMQGDLNSLNASVAAGILMYAVYNGRRPLN